MKQKCLKNCFKDVGLFVITDFETTGTDVLYNDYPIEIGIMITDKHLNVLDMFSSLINIHKIAPQMFDIEGETPNNKTGKFAPSDIASKCEKVKWNKMCSGAYKVHKIPAEDIVKAPPPESVVVDINSRLNKAVKLLPEKEQKKKKIIVSDNIQFEYILMERLYKEFSVNKSEERNNNDWPFHYCGWDTSLLLELTGVGDPNGVPHSAMGDVSILHTHLVRALEESGYYMSDVYPFKHHDH